MKAILSLLLIVFIVLAFVFWLFGCTPEMDLRPEPQTQSAIGEFEIVYGSDTTVSKSFILK